MDMHEMNLQYERMLGDRWESLCEDEPEVICDPMEIAEAEWECVNGR